MAAVIRITAKREGFRRAGLAHPAEPTDYPEDAFTPEQIAALAQEPMLTVERIEADSPKPKKPAKD